MLSLNERATLTLLGTAQMCRNIQQQVRVVDR